MRITEETAHSINGVAGRMYPRHAWDHAPETLWSAQKWISERRPYKAPGYKAGATIQAEIRFDDSCRNGHNTFAITGEIREPGMRDISAGGCIHDNIAAAFPEFAHLIRWHLCSTDGPMHYVANTVFHAGDRDHNGLRAGETRQIINGRTKQPAWELVAVNAEGIGISSTPTGDEYRNRETVPLFILEKNADCPVDQLPPVPALRWAPMLRHGEGKARDLDAARRVAVWPEATDAELTAEPAELKLQLEARLPGLIAEFRADMTAAGLAWSPADIA